MVVYQIWTCLPWDNKSKVKGGLKECMYVFVICDLMQYAKIRQCDLSEFSAVIQILSEVMLNGFTFLTETSKM